MSGVLSRTRDRRSFALLPTFKVPIHFRPSGEAFLVLATRKFTSACLPSSNAETTNL